MNWTYPTFAWFWDNDKPRLIKMLEMSEMLDKLKNCGIKPEDIGDFLEFHGYLIVIKRNGKIVVQKEDAYAD